MNKTMRDVKRLIASKKFVQYVALVPIGGIDYLQIDGNAKAIKTWNDAYEQVNSLEYVAEPPPSEIVLTRKQLDSMTDQELAAK